MKHYIILKFNDDYDYLNELEEIQELFNNSLSIDGVDKVEIYKSNSKLSNRYDLMIKMDLINLTKLSSEELLKGSFGIEWESLRVHSSGKLSLTPHPEVFGDKLENPFVTTDFSESQIEIITPAFDTIDEAFNTFLLLADLVNSSLPDDEYLWFQSLPGILPKNKDIPIAQYSEEGAKSQKYREDLAKKYGLKKQMISGVHFNFSFSDKTLRELKKILKSDLSFQEFKNQIAEISANKDLKIWERVSAAIGIAVFDADIDTSVENVFRRADKAMYQNKKEMKAVRD